jgi:hypothetical protein
MVAASSPGSLLVSFRDRRAPVKRVRSPDGRAADLPGRMPAHWNLVLLPEPRGAPRIACPPESNSLPATDVIGETSKRCAGLNSMSYEHGPEPTPAAFEFVSDEWDACDLAVNRSGHEAGLEAQAVRSRDPIDPNGGCWSAWPTDVAIRVLVCDPMLATLGYEQPGFNRLRPA